MPVDKLYIKVNCSMCKGSRRYSAGGYNNCLEPYKWQSCPYCDPEGKVFVEASVNVIGDYIGQLELEKYIVILQKIGAKKSES